MRPGAPRYSVSFNSLVRGGQVEAAHFLLQRWDFSESAASNFRRAQDDASMRLSSTSHARDIVKALRQRLEPNGRDLPLVVMAKRNVSMLVFKPCFLWHWATHERILYDFFVAWMFPRFRAGDDLIHTEDVLEFVSKIVDDATNVRRPWAPTTLRRAATSLLKIAADFGMLTESSQKSFVRYVLPEQAFLYILHAIAERGMSTSRAVRAADWRMFQLDQDAVEQELLRLHQFQMLTYNAAGSIVELSLPCTSSREYAERMVA